MKIAVIDIGSNSVRLMMWADGTSLYKAIETTRLGEGVAFTHRLSERAMQRTAQAVAAFVSRAEREGADRLFAFATAAVRSAQNGSAFVSLVRETCGAEVDVVSGSEEALLGLSGALGSADGGIIDIGGASTEVCFRTGGKIAFSASLDVGAVRLFDLCRDDRALLDRAVDLSALSHAAPSGRTYAIGGTASTIACLLLSLPAYDAARVQDAKLSYCEVEALAVRLLALSVDERKQLPGMDPSRVDIIAGGAYLLARVMQKLSLERVFFSDRDNLEGYLAVRGIV